MSKILIVDDSATLRESLSFVLTEEGYTVKEAINGNKALEIYSADKDFDLIISDINMPEMDGLEFLGNLRKINREVPVVMLTTESDKQKIETAKSLKASAWIIKPFRQDDLITVVKKLIK